mgnify:CR=1 FL=1
MEKSMKILNLYCGIGGNRKLWTPKGDEHEITAVENDEAIAKIYSDLFPKDKIIIGDAHEYLLKHYKEFDFIWSSPPCQSHSSFRHNICVRFHGTEAVYPDMTLWQEIIFLRHHAKNWIVENVKPYYEPLIKPDFILQRHYFWSNQIVPPKEFKTDLIRKSQILKQLAKIKNSLPLSAGSRGIVIDAGFSVRIIITGEPVGERYVDINFVEAPSLDYWVHGQLVEERVFPNVGEALKRIRPDLPSYLNPPQDP